MKLVNPTTVLLQEKKWIAPKPPKVKKGEAVPIMPTSNPEVIGEATVILSLDERLKKGDRVLINRTGLLNMPIGKSMYVIMDIEDILIKL